MCNTDLTHLAAVSESEMSITLWIHLLLDTRLVLLLIHPLKSVVINMSAERHAAGVIHRAQHYSTGPSVHGGGQECIQMQDFTDKSPDIRNRLREFPETQHLTAGAT